MVRLPVLSGDDFVKAVADAAFDPAFRVDERVGAEALDRRRGRQDGPRAPAGLDEPPDQVLVRLRLRCFFVEPFDELTRRAAREGPEAVQAAQLRQMLVPGLGPHRVVAELLPVQVELAADEVHDRRGNELARGQQAARVAEDAQLQRDALRAAGVDEVNLYHDYASGHRDDRPGLDSCLRALRNDDVLVVWKLDRLGRNLAHLVNTVQDLSARGVGLRVLAGQGAQIDTTTAAGRLVFGIFAALAEFERELIRERTRAGLKAARARGRKGGRKFALSKAQVRLAQAAMAHRDTSVSALCRELGISPVTLYRYVGPQGELRQQGQKVLAS